MSAVDRGEAQAHRRSADSSATVANALFAGAGVAALITFFAVP